MARRPVGAVGARWAVGALVAVIAAVSSTAGPARAQVGYPPGPCTATVNVSAMGPVAVGAVFDVVLRPLCAWTPGLPVSVTINGQFVVAKLAGPDGTVSINVTVLSTTTLSIDDPILVPATCGNNMVTGVGPSSVAGTTVTQSLGFTLDCTSVFTTSQKRGLLAFTGAALLRWAGVAAAIVIGGAALVSVARRRGRPAHRGAPG